MGKKKQQRRRKPSALTSTPFPREERGEGEGASAPEHPPEPVTGYPTESVAAVPPGERRQPGAPVVGIGASAGGLDAFKRFFAAMPAESGIVFVLIPHLDPAQESLMASLLSRHTSMPVVEATEGMPVEANHVYIIPPNKYLTIHNRVLRLTRSSAPDSRPPSTCSSAPWRKISRKRQFASSSPGPAPTELWVCKR
jgi:chemotaxis response regulator CheB